MAQRDLYNNIAVKQSVAPQTVTATLQGSEVDMQDFEAAQFVVDCGTITGSAANVTFKFQESNTSGSGFTDVAAGDLLPATQPTAITTANDAQVHERGYRGSMRYLRIIVETTSGAPSLPMSGQVVVGHGRHQPI
jgi:hypothetical protein